MAAVLCGGIGKALSGCCECLGQCCMLPFKACGVCCEGLGNCCSESCKFVTSCCSSSFCCYITVACALNIPGIIVGLSDVPNAVAGCAGSLWLLVFWLFCVVHIVAAFYMAYAVEKDDSILPPAAGTDVEAGQGGMSQFQEKAKGGAGRMKHLFCYDLWMAAYILVVLGYFGWLCLGGVWFATGTMDDADSCEESINGRVAIAFSFGWAFVFLGGCGLCCSLCCGIFICPGDNSAGNSSPHYVNTQPPSTSTNAAAHATVPIEDNVKASATTVDDKNNKASYAGNSTTSKPIASSTTQSEPMEVEVEAIPVNPKPTAPMATATPY